MFSSEYGEAIVEVLDILNNTNRKDVEKIPESFMEFLVKNASRNYDVKFDHTQPLSELNLMEKTKEILGVIYINWWCDNEEYEKYMLQIRDNRVKSGVKEVVDNDIETQEDTVDNVDTINTIDIVNTTNTVNVKDVSNITGTSDIVCDENDIIDDEIEADSIERLEKIFAENIEINDVEANVPNVEEIAESEANGHEVITEDNKISVEPVVNTVIVEDDTKDTTECKMLIVVNQKKGFFKTMVNKIAGLFNRQRATAKSRE